LFIIGQGGAVLRYRGNEEDWVPVGRKAKKISVGSGGRLYLIGGGGGVFWSDCEGDVVGERASLKEEYLQVEEH